MSKAFTKDEDSDAPLFVAPRAFLPEGTPNYVTAHGLELLRAEQTELEAARQRLLTAPDEHKSELDALAARQAELTQRLESAVLVDVSAQRQTEVRFGATVRLRYESGAEKTFQIVGVDEADPEHGSVAFVSPLARALSGAEVGGVVTVRTPNGEEEVEVLAIEYTD